MANSAVPVENLKKSRKINKDCVIFGVPLEETLYGDRLPCPLVDVLVYIAQYGVATSDIFRRPGNSSELKYIEKRLTEGKEIDMTKYNFFTLASVVKSFLVKIPGGILGADVERKIIKALEKSSKVDQYDYVFSIITKLSQATQQLLSLLFGTWFRVVQHSEFNGMSSEAMAKSVAGSLFRSYQDMKKIAQAVHVVQMLIDDFAVGHMFGRDNIHYFSLQTGTAIRVREKIRYEYQYPVDETMQYSQLELFALKLQAEKQTRGVCLSKNAISEETFKCTAKRRSKAWTSREKLSLSSHTTAKPRDASRTPKQQLTPTKPPPAHAELSLLPTPEPQQLGANTSSTSAPDIHQNVSPSTHISPASKDLSTSMSRFDTVKKRQIIAMRKRKDWFLADGSDTSGESSFLRQSPDVAKSVEDMPSDTARKREQSPHVVTEGRPGITASRAGAQQVVRVEVESACSRVKDAAGHDAHLRNDKNLGAITGAAIQAPVTEAAVTVDLSGDQDQATSQQTVPSASKVQSGNAPTPVQSGNTPTLVQSGNTPAPVQSGNILTSAQSGSTSVQSGNTSTPVVPTQKQAYCFLLDNFYGNISLKESVAC